MLVSLVSAFLLSAFLLPSLAFSGSAEHYVAYQRELIVKGIALLSWIFGTFAIGLIRLVRRWSFRRRLRK